MPTSSRAKPPSGWKTREVVPGERSSRDCGCGAAGVIRILPSRGRCPPPQPTAEVADNLAVCGCLPSHSRRLPFETMCGGAARQRAGAGADGPRRLPEQGTPHLTGDCPASRMVVMASGARSRRRGTSAAGTASALLSLLPLLLLQLPGGFALLLHEHDDHYHAHVLRGDDVAMAPAGGAPWHDTRHARTPAPTSAGGDDQIRLQLDEPGQTLIVLTGVFPPSAVCNGAGPSFHRQPPASSVPFWADARPDETPPGSISPRFHLLGPSGRTGAGAALLRNHALLL